MKRVLVTGASGFVGRHIAKYFASKGCEVVGLGHGGWPKEEWETWGLREWVTSDVTTEALLQFPTDPDVIVHCAGSGSVAFSLNHPALDYARTVDGTLHVLEYIRIRTPKTKMLYPSSAAVYGTVAEMPIRENSPINPVSPYGVHKVMAEMLCQMYAKHFGVQAAIIRVFSAYGPELRKQLLWDACSKAVRKQLEFPGSGAETRDFIFTTDFASLFYRAIEVASTDCPIANGASGHPTSVRQIVEMIFAHLTPGVRPVFSGASRAGDPVNYVADISRARSWGWSPEVSLETGVCEFVEWVRAELAK